MSRLRLTTIYIDTNVFISAFESGTTRRDYASRIFDAAAIREFVAVTSAITLAELLPRPLETNQPELVAFYKDFISSRGVVDVVPVTRALLIESAEARAQRKSLKLPDAIHIATAISSNCTAILSDDQRLPSLRGLPVIRLGPDTLADLRRLAA